MRQNKFVCFKEHTVESRGKASGKRLLRSRIDRVGFDLFDLQCVAGTVLGQDDQPLIAVEVAERDMSEEVAAEVAVNLLDEDDGFRARLAELGDCFGWVGEPAGWTGDFAGVEFCSAVGCDLENVMFLCWGEWLFFRLRVFGQGLYDDALEEVLKDNDVFKDFSDGPAVGGFAEVPLWRGEAGDEGEQTGFAGREFVQDKLALVGMHCRWMICPVRSFERKGAGL